MVHIFNTLLKVLLLALTLYLIGSYSSNKIQQYKDNKDFNVPISMAERERQLTCLAKNIYFEAASEPFEGKVAVAQVTINRGMGLMFTYIGNFGISSVCVIFGYF